VGLWQNIKIGRIPSIKIHQSKIKNVSNFLRPHLQVTSTINQGEYTPAPLAGFPYHHTAIRLALPQKRDALHFNQGKEQTIKTKKTR
jgi:hypothetical protein